MRTAQLIPLIALCSLAVSIVTGCGAPAAVSAGRATAGGGSGLPPPSPTALPAIPSPAIYAVASGFVTDVNWSPDSIIIFSPALAGTLNDDDDLPNWELAGSKISVDGAGNMYILTDRDIEVVPPVQPYLSISRSLPVEGPAAVRDLAASVHGEIFVSDGKGIAIYGASATGNDAPARYIQGISQTAEGTPVPIVPGLIAVDAADNLYVQNTVDSSIDVFGPADTGSVAPSRTISGALARLTSNGSVVMGMTTDIAGNLYVLCQCSRPDGSGSDAGIMEFGPTANGNVAPMRFITTPEMDSSFHGSGIAVDLAGTIYVSGNARILEFTANASGLVAPSNSVTSGYGTLLGIAVH